jgi:hypothetical protein
MMIAARLSLSSSETPDAPATLASPLRRPPVCAGGGLLGLGQRDLLHESASVIFFMNLSSMEARFLWLRMASLKLAYNLD